MKLLSTLLFFSYHINYCPEKTTQTEDPYLEKIIQTSNIMNCQYCGKEIKGEHKFRLKKVHVNCYQEYKKDKKRKINKAILQNVLEREKKRKFKNCTNYCIKGLAIGFLNGAIITTGIILRYWNN